MRRTHLPPCQSLTDRIPRLCGILLGGGVARREQLLHPRVVPLELVVRLEEPSSALHRGHSLFQLELVGHRRRRHVELRQRTMLHLLRVRHLPPRRPGLRRVGRHPLHGLGDRLLRRALRVLHNLRLLLPYHSLKFGHERYPLSVQAVERRLRVY